MFIMRQCDQCPEMYLQCKAWGIECGDSKGLILLLLVYFIPKWSLVGKNHAETSMVGSGADPEFVEPEADTIFAALFKIQNTKLWIQNWVLKRIFISNEQRNHNKLHT